MTEFNSRNNGIIKNRHINFALVHKLKMNQKYLLLFGLLLLECEGREPYKPRKGSLPFVVYFPSRYRGLCMGALVSRTAVITAAVCVTSPDANYRDQRPINVVTGTMYRHPRRGIRVQVTRVLIPNLSNMDVNSRGYLMQKSPAVLILKRKIPDILTEVPLRPIEVDWVDGDVNLQEECLMPGWHFFYKGDVIIKGTKFLLQRNLRAQALNVVKKSLWCEALSVKFQKALSNLGFDGYFDKSSCICVRDPERIAQPCHGMYGSPLICRGKIVGIMMAPDAQWTNCTGFSTYIHRLNSNYLKDFMTCVSSLFEVEDKISWDKMKLNAEDYEEPHYDYSTEVYDNIRSSSSSEEISI